MDWDIYDHHEPAMYISAVAGANGVAQGFLPMVAQGYAWKVERWTCWASANRAGSIMELYVQTANAVSFTSTTAGDRNGRQDLSLATANDMADNASPIYVPSGYYLVAVWFGMTSGDVCELTTQIAVHRNSLMIEEPSLVEQQVEAATPDINPHEVAEQDTALERLFAQTADAFKSLDKELF